MHPRHQRDVPGEILWMSDTVTLARLRLDITGFLGAFLVFSSMCHFTIGIAYSGDSSPLTVHSGLCFTLYSCKGPV